MSFTDVKIKIPERGLTREVNDVMHRKRARRILGDLKKSVVESCGPKKKGDFRELAVAGDTRVRGGGRCKSQHRKIVPLSLCRNL